ncbi:MAG: pectate lyase [Armatimonadota bacterium]
MTMRGLRATALCAGMCLLILFAVSSEFAAQEQQDQIRAFPGAEGLGAYSVGGRGGQVLAVTTLEDYDPKTEEPIEGSLRRAVTTEGPRTVIFRVSGIIELKAPLSIQEPYLTISGQTAPGDGICLKNYGTSVAATHDIIIRHVRFRPGDEVGRERVADGAEGWQTDSLSVGRSHNVILDHCSTSWANDEVLSVAHWHDPDQPLDNITVQWTLITESLHNSTHPKGGHGYGSIYGGHTTGFHARITMHHSLYAHHWARNPHFAGDREGNPPGSLGDFRNNVIYDWGALPAHNGGPQYTSVNFIGNYLKPGPSTRDDRRTVGVVPGSENGHFYLAGNHLTSLPEADEDNWAMVDTSRGVTRLEEPLETPPVPTVDAHAAYERVLERSGAWPRDAVDARVVEQVRDGTGGIIDSADDVGGWPDYSSAEPPIDTDEDGMPDDWETQRGLDPRDPDDAHADRTGDGYTNLEEYLHWAHEQVLGRHGAGVGR